MCYIAGFAAQEQCEKPANSIFIKPCRLAMTTFLDTSFMFQIISRDISKPDHSNNCNIEMRHTEEEVYFTCQHLHRDLLPQLARSEFLSSHASQAVCQETSLSTKASLSASMYTHESDCQEDSSSLAKQEESN